MKGVIGGKNIGNHCLGFFFLRLFCLHCIDIAFKTVKGTPPQENPVLRSTIILI